MSSPKRAARAAAPKLVTKTQAKSAGRTRPAAVRAVKPSAVSVSGASVEAERLAAALERSIADDKLDTVSAQALQKLIAAACRLYTARAQSGESFTPVARNSITATDVMITASGLLRSADLAVFELGMWQNWTGR
ncbi:MAG TPA: hypothetical protein VHY10_01515 [Xanthobacteraceae bacterium]|jgi:hypothetical protein|nr:hypothetical protein [Xanthobacteraceae bacterium]